MKNFIHRYVGPVEEVLTYPAHKLYKVRGPEKCYLIPAVQDIFIVDIDAEKREIYVKMIEGLETNQIDILTLFPDTMARCSARASSAGRRRAACYIRCHQIRNYTE